MPELRKRIDRQKFGMTSCFYHNDSRGNDETIEVTLNALAIPAFLIPQIKQPCTNVDGYLAARSLKVSVVQHCRIDPVLELRLVHMVNQNCQAAIAVPPGMNPTLHSHGVDTERCFTVNNAMISARRCPTALKYISALNFLLRPLCLFGTIGSLILRKSTHHILQVPGRFKRANRDLRLPG